MKKFLFVLLISFILSLTVLERANEDSFCKNFKRDNDKKICISLKDNLLFEKLYNIASLSPENARKFCYEKVDKSEYGSCDRIVRKLTNKINPK